MYQFLVTVDSIGLDMDYFPFRTMFEVRQFCHILDLLDVEYEVFKLVEV